MYYTFSTIAQVLAAFIALGGVFVLFKLQELNKVQLTQSQIFYNFGVGIFISNGIPEQLQKLMSILNTESVSDIISEMNCFLEEAKLTKHKNISSLDKCYNNLLNLELIKKKLKQLTAKSLYLGAFTIFFSLIILAFTTKIRCCEYWILLSGITLTAITISFMVRAIVLSLRENELVIFRQSFT